MEDGAVVVPLDTNTATYTHTIPSNETYGGYFIEAVAVADTSITASTFVIVAPEYIFITPASVSVSTNEAVTLTAKYDDGTDCPAHWYIANAQVANTQITYSPSFTTEGEYIVTAKWSYYPLIETTAVITVTDSGSTDPDPEPSPSPDPSDDYVTIPDMNASQNAQTSSIIASIEAESNIIQSAITALETTLSNSRIYDLFTQSFMFYDFDFETGDLSTTGNTYNGFVPTFNHWAQNVERYLGMLVEVRASKVEEEVKEETKGFWDILLGLFTPKENGDKATANTDDVSEFVSFGDDVRSFFDTGGNIDDVVTVLNSDSLWLWFTDEAAADLDTTITTFGRGEPIKDFYGESYSNFYENVLGREWGDS